MGAHQGVAGTGRCAPRDSGATIRSALGRAKHTYYHPDFRGSFSLKDVLPVLSPDSGYDDLAIADGLTAAARYVRAVETADEAQRRRLFDDLRAYCARDTLATVKVRQALSRIAEPLGSA